MSDKYDWLIKKTPRSVDQLRLWPENPRLNPEEAHLTLKDFSEDITEDNADKQDFYALINSLVEDGFVPADPIVVWQSEENQKYYVAEGNRRIIALKLLRSPEKAPKSIRSFIRKASKLINVADFEKVPVNVAPTFEDAEWYINQRNSSSSLQRRWSRVQQQRWILTLYEKHDGDVDKILSITKLSKSELEGFIRILKIKDFVKLDSVKNKLTDDEFEKADSYRFPITILERIISFSDFRAKWGLEFDGVDVIINSNHDSFYNAFTELIKRIVNKTDDNINTRLSKSDVPAILESLPEVSFDTETESEISSENVPTENELESTESEDSTSENPEQETESANESNSGQDSTPTIQHLKGNPNRDRIVLPIYHLNTDSYRLFGVFDEFKKISIRRYPNNISSSLRVFLDLAVYKYIDTEGLETAICSHYQCNLREVPLKKRLEYIKTHKASGRIQTIITRLIDPSQQFSLDVMNGFIHSQDAHYTNKVFLNGFWDFLFPLFQFLVDIREDQQ